MTTEQMEMLTKLKKLLDDGILSEKEFECEKQKIISQSQPQTSLEQENAYDYQETISPNEEDCSSVGWNILGFMTGIIGVIIYLVQKDNHPIRAKSILKWSLIGMAVSFAFSFIAFYIEMNL